MPTTGQVRSCRKQSPNFVLFVCIFVLLVFWGFLHACCPVLSFRGFFGRTVDCVRVKILVFCLSRFLGGFLFVFAPFLAFLGPLGCLNFLSCIFLRDFCLCLLLFWQFLGPHRCLRFLSMRYFLGGSMFCVCPFFGNSGCKSGRVNVENASCACLARVSHAGVGCTASGRVETQA